MIKVEKLNLWYGKNHALKDINIDLLDKGVTAFIGPSGCGKSTFLRCLNRLNDEIEGTKVTGKITYQGQEISSPTIDLVKLRQEIGMIFQQPNPFPSYSIFENIAIGLKINNSIAKSEIQGRVEWALKSAFLWEEVQNKLLAPATSLSGGQQQRLCIARAIALNPKVLLMDEPTSALDPIATQAIEELIQELKKTFGVIIVTHNMSQAKRVGDHAAFFVLGEIIENGTVDQIFNRPQKDKTKAYISGAFG